MNFAGYGFCIDADPERKNSKYGCILELDPKQDNVFQSRTKADDKCPHPKPNPRRSPYQNITLKNNTYFHMDGAEFVSKRHCFPLRFEGKFLNFQRTDPASSKIIHPPNWYLRCPLPPSGTSRNRGGTKGTFYKKTSFLSNFK